MRLPERFVELPKARQVLAQVAAVLKPKQFQVVVDIAGHYFVATLERKKGVTLAPLYPWVEDGEARKLMRSAVGSSLYQVLFKCWPEETRPLLFSGLEAEQDDAARGQLYVCLSKVEDPAAYHALARGMTVEPPGVLESLSQVIWRQQTTIELLVREYLVPAWPEDRALAHHLVKVLRDEYVELPPAWAAEAPEELLKVPSRRPGVGCATSPSPAPGVPSGHPRQPGARREAATRARAGTGGQVSPRRWLAHVSKLMGDRP
ncbi:hypothetical protein ACN469_23750 [Corallococcus terminator]